MIKKWILDKLGCLFILVATVAIVVLLAFNLVGDVTGSIKDLFFPDEEER